MIPITALWLPIVLSAVLVFIASAIIHMVLRYHRSDFRKLPNEESLLEALGAEELPPGNYVFPHAGSPKEMGSPKMLKKYEKGPVGLMNVIPNGPPALGKQLAQWFVYCLVVGACVAYLTGRSLDADAHYLAVFRIAGTTAFLCYSGSVAVESIFKGQTWSSACKNIFDGFVYATLTAGAFGWLWP